MGLRLQQSHPYKSARDIPDLLVDDLTVVAGINGAGKTHLLQAIKEGAVRSFVDDDLVDVADIALYDWTTFAVAEAREASLSEIKQRAESEWRQIQNQLRAGPVQNLLREAEGTVGLGGGAALLTASISTLTGDESTQGKIEELRRKCRELVMNGLNDQVRARAAAVEARLGCLVIEVSATDYIEAVLLEAEPINPLQQRVSDLFVTYNSLRFENDASRALATSGEDLTYREADEFERVFGPPPWEVLNDLLANQGLDFVVDPPGRRDTTYIVVLRQRTSGAVVSFTDLSSGERILMALAMSLYGTVETRHRITLPRVMLLDEVDAPLHPAMVRTYLRTVEEVLVANGVKVILTTHSPATVALCRSPSVWQMSKKSPRLERVPIRQALAQLTAGVAALSVRFEDRRQVFVESGYDADIYKVIYERLQAQIASDFNLEFVRASASKNEGGSSIVRTMVEQTREAGVDTAFGLIDWDRRNDPSADGAIVVLGHGKRYTIENYIFDPLLMAALLVREKQEGRIDGLPELLVGPGTWHGLDRCPSEHLQRIVDTSLSILGRSDDKDGVVSPLVGGESIRLPTWFCELPGHQLYDLWVSKIPFLNSFRGEEELKRAIVQRVVADVPELLSVDLLDIFALLASR